MFDSNKIAPLMDVLPLFTAPDVPLIGPEEEAVDPPFWKVSEPKPDDILPGGGGLRHTMLVVGEGCNTMFIVRNGKIIWTYSTGKGWEYDDIWMLSNGNIAFSRMAWAGVVTPQKKLIWRMDAPKGTEIHAIQPIGQEHVLLALNAYPPKAMLINTRTGQTEMEHELEYDPNLGVHSQCRRFRMTAEGTYLMPYLGLNKVVEYDRDFKPIWTYEVESPWAAVRLKNGNTLITDERHQTHKEVDRHGNTVWSISLSELPEKYRLADSQSCTRLENGNTILCSRGDMGNAPQMVEVTPDKELVWVFDDWSRIGPVTAVQILTESGIPEVPGQLER